MALVPLRLLLDHAAENGYGIPAIKQPRQRLVSRNAG